MNAKNHFFNTGSISPVEKLKTPKIAQNIRKEIKKLVCSWASDTDFHDNEWLVHEHQGCPNTL